GRRVATKREVVGTIGNLGRLTVGDLVDIDTRGVEEATMEELNLERQLFAAPQGALREEADLPVMVVIQVFQIIGQFGIGGLVRLIGRVARELPDNRSIERARVRSRGHDQATHGGRYQRDGGGSLKKTATVQGASERSGDAEKLAEGRRVPAKEQLWRLRHPVP